MNSWNEKTIVEKIATIISGIALCVWIVFEILGRRGSVSFAETAGYIAVSVVCVSEAIVYWRTKRVFSYIAIGGTVCIISALVLLSL